VTAPHALVCPTRSRPANAVRLGRACDKTVNHRFTQVYFVIDHDDPQRLVYHTELYREAPQAEVITVPPRGPAGLGPVLNWAAGILADEHEFVSFLGDDHLPSEKTPLWDEKLCWSLGGKPGVAYGDDLFQRQNLPTACVISAEVIRVLGYMVPPAEQGGPVHLFLDDWWKRLGLDLGNLRYLPDVVIEHLHPAAGKARPDQRYLETGMSYARYHEDKRRWDAWSDNVWPGELARLREGLRAAA